MLDFRRCNISPDANALDRNNSSRDTLVKRFQAHATAGTLTVVYAGGVRKEVQHPRTLAGARDVVLPRVVNLQPELTPSQRKSRRRVAAVLQGNARSGAHTADASHLSEAAETGCGYFITHDRRILAKRDELRHVLPPTLTIVTLTEFFDLLDRFEAGRPR